MRPPDSCALNISIICFCSPRSCGTEILQESFLHFEASLTNKVLEQGRKKERADISISTLYRSDNLKIKLTLKSKLSYSQKT